MVGLHAAVRAPSRRFLRRRSRERTTERRLPRARVDAALRAAGDGGLLAALRQGARPLASTTGWRRQRSPRALSGRTIAATPARRRICPSASEEPRRACRGSVALGLTACRHAAAARRDPRRRRRRDWRGLGRRRPRGLRTRRRRHVASLRSRCAAVRRRGAVGSRAARLSSGPTLDGVRRRGPRGARRARDVAPSPKPRRPRPRRQLSVPGAARLRADAGVSPAGPARRRRGRLPRPRM